MRYFNQKMFLVNLLFIAASAIAALTGSIEIKAKSDLTSSNGISSAQDRVNLSLLSEFTNGTGSAQINTIWHDERELSSGASETLSFGGTLINALGEIASFAFLQAMVVDNENSSQTLTVTSQFWNGATESIQIKPSGKLNIIGSYSVSGDKISISNQVGATATYRIWFIGTSE